VEEDIVKNLITQIPSLGDTPRTDVLDATGAALIARSAGIIENTAATLARLHKANEKKSEASKRHIVNSLDEAERVNQKDLLEAALEVVEEAQTENPEAETFELVKKVRNRRKK